jgi:hypothetical protein
MLLCLLMAPPALGKANSCIVNNDLSYVTTSILIVQLPLLSLLKTPKAKLWENINRKVYGFLYIPC